MSAKSLLAMFHEAGKRGGSDAVEIYDLHLAEEKKERKKLGDTIGHLQVLLGILDGAGLVSGGEPERAELEKKKETAKNLMNEALTAVKNYLSAVAELGHYKESSRGIADQKKFIEQMTAMDQARTTRHETLIDAVNIANRFITKNFGEIPDDELERFKDDEEKRGRGPLQVARIKLPHNGICPDAVNLKKRDSIADWAAKLGEELAVYKKINGRDFTLPYEARPDLAAD